MRRKKVVSLCLILILLILPFLTSCRRSGGEKTIKRIKMATTTSVQDSGLLDVLLPPFEKKFNVRVDVVAVGTGKALKLGENGDVDVVFVHDPEGEDKFARAGFGVNHRKVMYNYFLIVGPKDDPAKIKGRDTVRAFKKIARKEYFFVSRGDESGTHKKEKRLWKAAGITPKGKWYLETGQGMGATLQIANEKKAYTLVDRGTYIAFAQKISLVALSQAQGDKNLFNPYSIMAVNPGRYPQTNYLYAMALIAWVTSPEGQKIIREYQKEGRRLFYPSVY